MGSVKACQMGLVKGILRVRWPYRWCHTPPTNTKAMGAGARAHRWARYVAGMVSAMAMEVGRARMTVTWMPRSMSCMRTWKKVCEKVCEQV